jgi:hypothetical protein
LDDLYRNAYDRIQSGGTGAGWSGIHYDVFDTIRRYGRVANDRNEAVRELKKLLDEYAQANFGETKKKETDEEFLSRYEDEM